MRAPDFWYSDRRTITSWVLAPLSWLYGFGGKLRNYATSSQKADLPVICIGNFVAGGAGKTPTALAIAALLKQSHKTPGFLTRGYGGELSGPVVVDPAQHSSKDVGDEALLLANACPTIVARNRADGARQFSIADIDIIIMDDGFQNPSLHKDLALIVIDHHQGIGNGCVIPSGPLRAPITEQISKAHGFIIIGGELVNQDLMQQLKDSGKPIFNAYLEARSTALELANKKVIAFTGIGMPDKFFATLEGVGADLIESIRFPDHHPFTQNDAQWLLELQGDNPECLLITTSKDHIRLKDTTDACGKLHQAARSYEVELKFDQEQLLSEFILNEL